MTEEEVKAYVAKIETSSVDELDGVLPKLSEYNADIKINKICDALAENIKTLRELNSENDNHELDSDIHDLEEKLMYCAKYIKGENKEEKREVVHQLVFAKTPAGKPYFLADLKSIPEEVYGEVKKTLENAIYGVDMADNTKAKFYTNNNFPFKVLEFKGYQVRIFTTMLKDNILCVVGVEIKKDNNNQKMVDNLKFRLSKLSRQINDLKDMVNMPKKREEIFNDSNNILAEIMRILNREPVVNDDEIEELFPEGLDEGVVKKIQPLEVDAPEIFNKESLPVSIAEPKKIRRRGLGKKTILRRQIMDSLKGLTVDELLEVKKLINVLNSNKEISSSIETMYRGFLNMTDEELRDFEDSIKYFKNDEIGRHK